MKSPFLLRIKIYILYILINSLINYFTHPKTQEREGGRVVPDCFLLSPRPPPPPLAFKELSNFKMWDERKRLNLI
jgi:hypothetical protein